MENQNNLVLSPIEKEMIERMQTKDDYIVIGTGGLFWANENHSGCLIEGLTYVERSAITSLEQKGIIKHESHTKYLL